MNLHPLNYMPIIKTAICEDMAQGDVTSQLVIQGNRTGKAELIAQDDGILCGSEIFSSVMHEISESIEISWKVKEGFRFSKGEKIGCLYGRFASLLTAERTAINFLERMSGIATHTAYYCDALIESGIRIMDTRKTIPGLRYLEKYAVTVGGGFIHRFNLADGILITRNHLIAAGGIEEAFKRVNLQTPHALRVEVEVNNQDEALEAIDVGAEGLICMDMNPEELTKVVQLGHEHSIAVHAHLSDDNIENIKKIAECKPDFIILPALTENIRKVHIKMNLIS